MKDCAGRRKRGGDQTVRTLCEQHCNHRRPLAQVFGCTGLVLESLCTMDSATNHRLCCHALGLRARCSFWNRSAPWILPPTIGSAMLWGAQAFGCTLLVFRPKITLEDAIGSHSCSLQANRRVTNSIPLWCSLIIRVPIVNCVQTLKAQCSVVHILSKLEDAFGSPAC
jgi:hypothetical protein